MLHKIAEALIAYGPPGVFLLALLDSLGVPLPAAIDALLLLVAWKTPDRAYLTAGLAIVGSLIGNIGLFWAARGGSKRWVKSIPEPEKPQRFRRWFRRYGLVTVFIPAMFPVIPLPLKVFVISAGVLHTRFSKFLAVILLARVMRYFGEAYIGIQLGENAQHFLEHNAFTIVGAALGLAFAMVLAIKLNDRRRDATIL
ncbi:MAG: VTT domain-containing protein [Bryobacteraceae bacterium]